MIAALFETLPRALAAAGGNLGGETADKNMRHFVKSVAELPLIFELERLEETRKLQLNTLGIMLAYSTSLARTGAW